MPNIPSFPRGFAETFQNIKQSEDPVGTIKTGFYGENKKFDIGDLATPFKNIGKGYATAGTGGALLGAFQTLADYFRSPEGIPKTGETSVFDFANTFSAPTDSGLQMPTMGAQVSNMFQTQRQTPDFYRPPIQKTGETSVQDFTNVFTPPSGSGLQMPQEQQTQQQAQPQVMDTQTVTAPPQQRVTPQKMPMPSDLDYIFGADQSAYQSRSAPSYVNPMTANKGFFDMNKAGTVGGNYVQGAGWLTQADKAFGKKAEDLQFEAMMRQRMANMFS
jgi:hypothetical protein